MCASKTRLLAVIALSLLCPSLPAADIKDDVLFHASFNGTIEPEVQKGDKGANGTSPAEFTEGHKVRSGGKALVTGHSKNAYYPVKGNLNAAEGTIKFWVMPIDWSGDDQLFHHFFRVLGVKPEGNPGARVFDLLIYKYVDWNSVAAFGMSGELQGAGILQIPMGAAWKPKKWHQIAFTWDKDGASLYVDGEGTGHKYFLGAPDVMTAADFHVGGPYFAENKTLTAIDDLYIYKRKLASSEIADLYKAEMLDSLMPR